MLSRALLGLVCAAACTFGWQRAPAQTIPPEVQKILAPTGKLRVGLLTGDATQALKDAGSGELKGVGFDLGRHLAQRMRVPFEPVLYQSIGALLDKGKAGDWDVSFIGYTPARAKDWDFAPAHLEVEFGYLVAAGSSISTMHDVDRPGIRVGVQDRSGPDAFLSRNLKSADIVRVPDYESAVEMQKSGKLDAIFSIKPILYELSVQMSGARVLEGAPGTVPQAMAIPKGRDAGMQFAATFIKEAKSTGVVKAALERAGLHGVNIPAE